MKNLLKALILIISIIILPAYNVCATWIDYPNVINDYYGREGPDGILFTADDLILEGLDGIFGTGDDIYGIGITSSYNDGKYMGPANVALTVNTSLTSTVFLVAPNTWEYTWTITNTGTGPLVEFYCPAGGPTFSISEVDPLWGTAGIDRIPDTADDVDPETLKDIKRGGPPKIAQWGGKWNPETDMVADEYVPSSIPEPTTMFLLSTGLIGLACIRRKKTKK